MEVFFYINYEDVKWNIKDENYGNGCIKDSFLLLSMYINFDFFWMKIDFLYNLYKF